MWGFFSGGGGGGGSSASSSDNEASAAVSRVSVSRPTTGKAVKWIGMKRAEGDGAGGDKMFVGAEATRALAPLGDKRVNLISIFGAARQGKSFLMNLLADQQDLFKISNLREPCTQGVDLSGYFVPLKDFSAVNGCRPVTTSAGHDINVGFVDAEGQGDRDITYDSRLVSPVLLTSKVVIFNWKDSLQADRILNLLAVLARAAQGIELGEDDSVKVFGHLHLVFRDWNFVNSTPEEVFNDLFKKEKGFSNEVNVRNSARTTLQEAFQTINVWLFPPPVENTANLREKIRFEQLHHSFQDKLCEFRTTLSQQLKEPTLFYTKQLTARLLTDIMPALVDTLNSDQVIMPESIFSSIVRAQANAVKERCQRSILDHVEAIAVEEVMSNDELEKLLNEDVGDIIEKAMGSLSNVPANVIKEIKESLQVYAKKEIQIALHANNEKITAWVSKEADTVFQNLKRECSLLEKNALPMKRDSLKAQWTALLHAELAKVEQLPTGINGRRDIDRECSRIRQHGEILFDKIDVANERAIQRSSAAVNEALRKAKTRLTNEINDFVNAKFADKHPITINGVLNELEARYATVKQCLVREAGEIAHFTLDFNAELEAHKSQIAAELNRRYFIEVQHILNEAGFNSRDNLAKEISRRLDGKLPLLDQEMKKEVDESVKVARQKLNTEIHGWTILKTDAEAKGKDLENFADTLTDQYLRRNRDLEVDANARREKEQYDELRVKILKSFEDAIKSIGFPMDEMKIDEVFRKVLQDEAARFLSFAQNKTSFTIKELRESLTSDCQSSIDTQKFLNSVAQEKLNAVKTAERERQLREAEAKTAHERERQISELKNYVSQTEREKQSEAKRLRDQLAEEERKRRSYELEMEHHRARFAQLETEKRNAELRARAESQREVRSRESETLRVKRELEELQLRAAQAENEKRQLELRLQIDAQQRQDNESLKRQLEELRSKAAAMERQQRAMEREVQEQVELRTYAEAEAARAAAAAELSARAAIEAARYDSPLDVRRKRNLSGGSEDVDMEDAAPYLPARAPAKNSSPAAAPSERKKARVPVKATKTGSVKKRMSLAEARKAAQEEVERRVQARAQSLSSAKKKK